MNGWIHGQEADNAGQSECVAELNDVAGPPCCTWRMAVALLMTTHSHLYLPPAQADALQKVKDCDPHLCTTQWHMRACTPYPASATLTCVIDSRRGHGVEGSEITVAVHIVRNQHADTQHAHATTS